MKKYIVVVTRVSYVRSGEFLKAELCVMIIHYSYGLSSFTLDLKIEVKGSEGAKVCYFPRKSAVLCTLYSLLFCDECPPWLSRNARSILIKVAQVRFPVETQVHSEKSLFMINKRMFKYKHFICFRQTFVYANLIGPSEKKNDNTEET